MTKEILAKLKEIHNGNILYRKKYNIFRRLKDILLTSTFLSELPLNEHVNSTIGLLLLIFIY